MPKCYAENIGGCSAGISREHYISKALLELSKDSDGAVVIDGLPSKDGLRLKTKNAAVSKILCANHNSKLSSYDTCFSDFVKSLIDFNQSRDNKKIILDGKDTTCWLIKTFLGNLVARNLQDKIYQGENQFNYLVNVLYSKLDFNDAFGFTLEEENPPEMTKVEGCYPPWSICFVRSGDVIIGLNVWAYPFKLTFLIPGINYNNLRPLGCSFNVLGEGARELELRVTWDESNH